MKIRIFLILISVMILPQLASGAVDEISVTSSEPTSDPSVRIEPAGPVLGPEFSVDFTVTNVVDLYGVSTDINFDPTLLEYVSITPGNFFSNGGCLAFPLANGANAGKVIFGLTALPPCGVGGSGTIATFTFRSLGVPGTSTLSFSNNALTGLFLSEISAEWIPGEVVFSENQPEPPPPNDPPEEDPPQNDPPPEDNEEEDNAEEIMILSHNPADGSIDVNPDANIVLSFNREANVLEAHVSGLGNLTVSGSGTPTVTINPDSLEANTLYTVTLTGITDTDGNILSDYSWSFTTAIYYEVELFGVNEEKQNGWNLFSLPVTPDDAHPMTVLGTEADNVNSVWSYDPSNPNADPSGWLVYVPGDPEDTNNLKAMSRGRGYWAEVAHDLTLSGTGSTLVPGPIIPFSHLLYAGWNLFGYYHVPAGASELPLTEALSSLLREDNTPFWTSIWSYDNRTGVFTVPSKAKVGNGYWIGMPEEKQEYEFLPKAN